MFKQRLTFKNSRNLKLSAIFEGENKNAPIVIMCHGYGSSKDNPLSSRALAKKIIAKGICVFRFDFTGHGESEGGWAEITPLEGLDDLESAARYIKIKAFALYGSSFGGYVSLLYASQNPLLALALKAPVSDYIGASKLNISISQRVNFTEHLRDIDLYEKAKDIKTPVLIIHGDKDDVVPINQSYKLIEALQCKKELRVLKGANHDIRGADLEYANTQIADFFEKELL